MIVAAGLAAAAAGWFGGPALIDCVAANDSRSTIPVVGALGVAAAHDKYDLIASVAIGAVAFFVLRRIL